MESMKPSELRLPGISQTDMERFHATHFSTASTYHFAEQYLDPVEVYEYVEDADDDYLGYYDDGAKRTLTDEQIAIFRHSEIQALLRARRNAQDARAEPSNADAGEAVAVEAEVEDGELEDGSPTTKPPTPPGAEPERALNKKQRKAQKARNKGYFKQNIKPDLRKRTWDKVEKGVGSLAYDDDVGRGMSASGFPLQRRRISYDD